jgi:hypothetical protein
MGSNRYHELTQQFPQTPGFSSPVAVCERKCLSWTSIGVATSHIRYEEVLDPSKFGRRLRELVDEAAESVDAGDGHHPESMQIRGRTDGAGLYAQRVHGLAAVGAHGLEYPRQDLGG